jgi:KDO2-lipid IV(A) lauroyltransferase
MAAFFLAFRVGQTVIPMETIDDPGLQAYFERTRGVAGVRLVGLREARRKLTQALRDGIPVGLVGDRDLTGGGIPVSLFGAPASLPIGPPLLALETDAPIFVAAVRRSGAGRYLGRLVEIPLATEGDRRQRLTATLEAVARAFEEVVATAPDQWWTIFFPIWPDLEVAARGGAEARAGAGAP